MGFTNFKYFFQEVHFVFHFVAVPILLNLAVRVGESPVKLPLLLLPGTGRRRNLALSCLRAVKTLLFFSPVRDCPPPSLRLVRSLVIGAAVGLSALTFGDLRKRTSRKLGFRKKV